MRLTAEEVYRLAMVRERYNNKIYQQDASWKTVLYSDLAFLLGLAKRAQPGGIFKHEHNIDPESKAHTPWVYKERSSAWDVFEEFFQVIDDELSKVEEKPQPEPTPEVKPSRLTQEEYNRLLHIRTRAGNKDYQTEESLGELYNDFGFLVELIETRVPKTNYDPGGFSYERQKIQERRHLPHKFRESSSAWDEFTYLFAIIDKLLFEVEESQPHPLLSPQQQTYLQELKKNLAILREGRVEYTHTDNYLTDVGLLIDMLEGKQTDKQPTKVEQKNKVEYKTGSSVVLVSNENFRGLYIDGNLKGVLDFGTVWLNYILEKLGHTFEERRILTTEMPDFRTSGLANYPKKLSELEDHIRNLKHAEKLHRITCLEEQIAKLKNELAAL